VLIIGDSHIASKYFFNNALHDALIRQGAIVHSYGVCGSGARDWVLRSMLPCGRGERHNEEPAQIDPDNWVQAWSLKTLIARHGKDSTLAASIGSDRKGAVSLVVYATAIPVSFVQPWIACAGFVMVAVMWLLPDPRIEKALGQ